MTGLQLRTYDNQFLTVSAGEQLEIEENRQYEIVFNNNSKSYQIFWGETLIEPDSSGLKYIQTGHWVGDIVLRIDDLPILVSVKPREEKISDTLWVSMLQDLEDWLPGVSTGVEGGKGGQVGSSGVSAPLIAEALSPLLPAFERAIRSVLEQPKLADISIFEELPLRKVRRVDRETLKWVSRHPEIHEHLDPWKSLELSEHQPTVLQRRTIDILDHQVNRYISWLIRRVEQVLKNTAIKLDDISNGKLMDETAFWCKSRSKSLRQGSDRLLKLWRSSFLSLIRQEPLTETALQIVLDEPDYARVHKIGRLFLNPLFQLHGENNKPKAAVRPSFSIYELWCFFAIGEQLKIIFPDWIWTTSGKEKLLGSSATGEGARYHALSPSGDTIQVLFNSTFAGYFYRSDKARWSISGERRPDIIVCYKPHGKEGKWICMDAKYRVGQKNLSDAFSSVHIYRDSLRYSGYGGRCQASVLLAPSMSVDTEDWFCNEYLSTHGGGVWELKPGLSSCELGVWLTNVLMH